MRRAAKVDDNQARLVDLWRKMGCSVEYLFRLGNGVPDVMIGVCGINLLAEIKDGAKSASKRKLTDDELEWHAQWRGQKAIIETDEQAIALIQSVRRAI